MSDLTLPVVIVRDESRAPRSLVSDASTQLTGPVDLHVRVFPLSQALALLIGGSQQKRSEVRCCAFSVMRPGVLFELAVAMLSGGSDQKDQRSDAADSVMQAGHDLQ